MGSTHVDSRRVMIIHDKRYSYQKLRRGYRGGPTWGGIPAPLAAVRRRHGTPGRPSLAMQSEPGVVRLNSSPSRRPGCLRRRDGLKTDRKSMSHPSARTRIPRENKQNRVWDLGADQEGSLNVFEDGVQMESLMMCSRGGCVFDFQVRDACRRIDSRPRRAAVS